MLAAAGRVGDGAIMYASVDPGILRAGVACVRPGARRAAARLDDLDIAIWAPMSVGRDRTLARDHARGRVASALRHPLPVPFSAEDVPAVERLRRGYDAFQHATAASRHRALVPDRLVDLMALAGTPDEVREQVGRVMAVPEIGRIILLPQVPGTASTRGSTSSPCSPRRSWPASNRDPAAPRIIHEPNHARGGRGPRRGPGMVL